MVFRNDHYHLLVFSSAQDWGAYFGTGGVEPLDYYHPPTYFGVFMNHPTFVSISYELAGSSTEQISSYR